MLDLAVTDYVLIESHDPVDGDDVRHLSDLAEFLARDEGRATMLFVQDGIFAALAGYRPASLKALERTGVKILADGSSLRARGIPLNRLGPGIRSTDAEVPMQALLEGRKALWITDRHLRRAA
jgi:hypothetical protein